VARSYRLIPRVQSRCAKVHTEISDRAVTFNTQQSLLQQRDGNPLTVASLAA